MLFASSRLRAGKGILKNNLILEFSVLSKWAGFGPIHFLLYNSKKIMKTLVDRREDLIKTYIENKSVLDLGVGGIAHRFLHKFVVENSKSAVGIELEPKRVKALKKLGYDVIQADAQDFNLSQKFDIIIAGDLVEHLTNFDGFFNCVCKHLKKGGFLLLNTPNIYSIRALIRGIFGKYSDLEEHTCGFDENLILQLIGRYPSLKVVDFKYFNHKTEGYRDQIVRFFGRLNKKYCENMLIVAKKT